MDQPFGGFTEEALAAYQKAVAEKEGVEFSEGGTYDFTTCIRPDGSAYGTGGKCRKGTEGEAKKDSKAGKSGSGGFDMDKAKKERTDLAGDIVDLALKGSTKPEDMEKLRALKARALELDKQIIAGGGKMEGRVQNQANQARHRMAGTTKKVLEKAKAAKEGGQQQKKKRGPRFSSVEQVENKLKERGYEYDPKMLNGAWVRTDPQGRSSTIAVSKNKLVDWANANPGDLTVPYWMKKQK
jgi:hypothetical protein